MNTTKTDPTDYGLYAGIAFGVIGIILFLLQENGVEVNWVTSAAIYLVCIIIMVWSTLRHALPGRSRVTQYAVIVPLALICISLGTCGTVKQYQKEHPRELAVPPVVKPTAPTPIPPVVKQGNPKVSSQDVPKTSRDNTKRLPPSGKVQGSDNTLVGDVGKQSITGNGNTIVGATDSNGNTILNRGGTAIGSGATADQTGIAIGAGAHAGSQKQPNTDTNNAIVSGTGIVLSAQIQSIQSPSIVVDNLSNRVANGVTWELVMFRHSDAAFFSFATQNIGYVKPGSTSANYVMSLETLPKAPSPEGGNPQIHAGDVFTGSVSIDCPECKGETYIVHFVWGESGWMCEIKDVGARLYIPKDMSKDGRQTFITWIERLAPVSQRIPIL